MFRLYENVRPKVLERKAETSDISELVASIPLRAV
jgi:hypothetical protein